MRWERYPSRWTTSIFISLQLSGGGGIITVITNPSAIFNYL